MNSIYLLEPLSECAKEWIDNNLSYEPWQKMGDNITIEHRYIGEIIDDMQGDGLEIDKDFTIH